MKNDYLKKIFLFTILCLGIIVSNAQDDIGSTKDAVIVKYGNSYVSFTSSDGYPCLSYSGDYTSDKHGEYHEDSYYIFSKDEDKCIGEVHTGPGWEFYNAKPRFDNMYTAIGTTDSGSMLYKDDNGNRYSLELRDERMVVNVYTYDYYQAKGLKDP